MSQKKGIVLILFLPFWFPFLHTLHRQVLSSGASLCGPTYCGIPPNSTPSFTFITDLAIIIPCHVCMLDIYIYISGLIINFCLCTHFLPLLCLRQENKKSQIPPSSDFCSIQILNGLNDAHSHWREQSTLLSVLVHNNLNWKHPHRHLKK